MRLRDPGSVDSTLASLEGLRRYLGRSLSDSTGWRSHVNAYLSWATTADLQCRSSFVDGELANGLFSETYWQIHSANSLTPDPEAMVDREAEAQRERLSSAIDRLRAFKKFVDAPGLIVVPDSSALVRGEVFWDFKWDRAFGQAVRLIVPILVVEELDRLKDMERNTRAGNRARSVLKRLREVCREVDPGSPAKARSNTTIEVFLDDDWHLRRPNNDAEIIEQALVIESLTGRPVTLTCVDASMEFRARQYGLQVHEMPTAEEVREETGSAASG